MNSRREHARWFGCLIGMACLLAPGADAVAQAKRPLPRAKSGGAKETMVTVELVTGPEGVGLRAQEWMRIFQELNVPFKVREARLDEQLGTKETSVGGFREVVVQGRLEKNGSLTFENKSFRQTDTVKLKEWLQELRKYGAQGSPTGQPMWGLNKDQFKSVFESLAEPLNVEPQGQKLREVAMFFKLPEAYPLRWTSGAEAALAQMRAEPVIRQSLRGVTHGTALAIALGESGLGFRPRRTPQGQIELTVIPLTESTEVWPIGWPLIEPAPKIAPQLYKNVRIDFEDETLEDVLNAASDVLKIRIFIDDFALRERKIDLAKVAVSHPKRETTWSGALKSLGYQAKLRREVWMDERGQPFVWITPLTTKRTAKE